MNGRGRSRSAVRVPVSRGDGQLRLGFGLTARRVQAVGGSVDDGMADGKRAAGVSDHYSDSVEKGRVVVVSKAVLLDTATPTGWRGDHQQQRRQARMNRGRIDRVVRGLVGSGFGIE